MPRKNSLKPGSEGVAGRAILGGLAGLEHVDRAGGAGRRRRADARDIPQHRLLEAEHRAGLDIGARPEAQAADRSADRDLQLEPRHVISAAAERVADPARRRFGELAGRVIGRAQDPRPDAADVEAAKRARAEEAVGDPDRVGARRCGTCRTGGCSRPRRGPRAPSRRRSPSIWCRRARLRRYLTSPPRPAKSCDTQPLAAGRANAVGVVEQDRIADRRSDPARRARRTDSCRP